MVKKMSSEFELLTQLKSQLVDFFDDLIGLLPNETDFVVLRIFIKDRVPIEDVMKYISLKLLPLKTLIDTRDEKFFLENNILFEQLDKNKVNHFKRIWLSKDIDNQDKDIIWKWFTSLIYLAKKYTDLKAKERV